MAVNNYAEICSYVHDKAGIVLNETKAYLIESRLSSIARQFGFADVMALGKALATAPRDVGAAVVDAMTTNESFFFRDTTPFQTFEMEVLPRLVDARGGTGKLRIWCAAASTGQEPYSLAMLFHKAKAKLKGMDVEILGTDISPSALARARAGQYSQFEVQRGLPVQLLVEHFTQVGTDWVISDAMKKMVRLQPGNLLDPMNGLGNFDVVFCRNVLIYFDTETKTKVLNNIARVMRPDGYLVLGAAETIMGVTGAFERAEGQRGFYRPAADAQRRMTA